MTPLLPRRATQSQPGGWLGLSVAEADEAEIRMVIAVGVLEREAAKSELAGMGINASPCRCVGLAGNATES
jgi:hypothetical protein